MNIKSLLIGSAALSAVATGAQAADAIVVPEPEPMEYVRVCDVYGAGFFYIPGTETCLKIGGYVRYEIGYSDGDISEQEGWRKMARATVTLDARSETEYGTLGGFIELRFQSGTDYPEYVGPLVNEGEYLSYDVTSATSRVQQAIIALGGLSMGIADTLYAAGLSGEFDRPSDPRVHFIRYTFDGANGFQAAVALEEVDEGYDWTPNVVGKVGFAQGWGGVNVWGAYDATAEEFAIKAIAAANLTQALWLEAIGTYESGINFYSVDPDDATGGDFFGGTILEGFREGAEWSAGGLIGYKFNPRFKASLGAQYFSNVGHDAGTAFYGGEVDALRAGATLDYAIVENFTAKLAVNYTSFDLPTGDLDQWHGFLRFDRKF
ncbi:porin [Chelativorans sp. AA-79]|uniref:porin n=2 Tax=unclassified Chelativorans TaxID=2643807 RepID=UPI0023F62026|nr:porin [Chelativorans sp. AA-79]WEX07680.1 porin [Chelativorans sp. AA-79]